MAKNLIPEIAKMLGVELGEEFKVKGDDELTYIFTDDGLKITYDGGIDGDIEIAQIAINSAFAALANGKDEIVKLPWKPKIYDIYWTFKAAHIDVWCITEARWMNNPNDVAAFKNGWVYRTQEEAKSALPKVAAELGVEYKL